MPEVNSLGWFLLAVFWGCVGGAIMMVLAGLAKLAYRVWWGE